ncbi:MAG TPA: carboxypeptidase-like regulatory domain-containing protein [Pyrinomonadaceae bacterium]|nr:carboxypeptidase-like regulatory domain-containing protein [Pyrinomonadaceae bacterium]
MKTRVFVVFLLIAVCSGFQTRISRVAGVVFDVNEARIVGATIVVENTAVRKIVRSDDEGRFEVDVPEGTYQITVEQPGFKKFRRVGLRVDADTSHLDVRMEVAPPKMPLKVH